MTQPDPNELLAEIARLRRRLDRERATRTEAEAIAEKGLRDLYERQRELQTLERVAARANQGGSTHEVLQFCAQEICRHHDWKAAHGYLAVSTENGPKLQPAGVWFAETDHDFGQFQHVTQQSEFHGGEGLPGRALQSGRPVWIADIRHDSNFPRLDIGAASGLYAAVAFPVLSGADVVAVLEFFDTAARAPSQSMLDMMAQIGTQLGRVIERQTAEQMLRDARDEAEAADRAKSTFLANMSHELRTPLNAIIGFSEMMQQQIFGPMGKKYLEYAGDIHRSGEHLKSVINDILDLSKIAVGALELREAQVSVPAIVESCRRIVSPLALEGQVSLEVDLPAALPPLWADETRLRQSVLNLLSNGVKFTPAGGRVVLAVEWGSSDLIISVSDTGIGMSEKDIAIALQPFRQIDSSLNRRYEGTGLGLPLAKAFAELHGGTLSIRSRPGAGTCAQIVIPASRCVRQAG